MPQHNHRSIRIVDNLADMTSQHDRLVLEKSLLKTLNELLPSQDLRLFRVSGSEEKRELNLLTFCIQDVIGSSDELPTITPTNERLSAALVAAIDNEDVQQVKNEDDDGWHIIYPAFDSQDTIFAILVHTVKQQPSSDEQRLVFGILRVYANYLKSIDRTQRDKLTGLFNRETLDDEINKILVMCSNDLGDAASPAGDPLRRRLATKYWLGVVDIDHFKSINDSYGHLYGDEVIILVARLMISGCIREDDLVYRYGGEEFVVLLKAPDEEAALRVFDRLRTTISDNKFPQLDKVTVSIGFTEVAGQQSPSDVIGQADEALYYAKHHGRNQVHSYQILLNNGNIEAAQQVAATAVEFFN